MHQIRVESKFPDFESLFWLETAKFTKALSVLGAPVISEPERVFDKFCAADIEKKQAFLDRVRFYSSLCQEAIIEDIPIVEDKRFIWHTLKRLNLRPPSDLFEKIVSGDYIEIYDSTGVQIFANLEFCSIISYSIEETFWHSFDELYCREKRYTEQLMGAFVKCFSGCDRPFVPEIDKHICAEVFSEKKNKAIVEMKIFSPIFDSANKPSVMLGSSRIKLLI